MTQQQINTDDTETLNKALRLLVNIREAAGDPEGKLMQDELVARIRRMREGLKEIRSIPFLHSAIYKSNVKSLANDALQ